MLRESPALRTFLEATEEAVVNALFAARTTVGRDGYALRAAAEAMGLAKLVVQQEYEQTMGGPSWNFSGSAAAQDWVLY